MAQGTSLSHRDKIVAHYEQTTPLYKKFWYFGKAYALHNGFYDKRHLTPFRALENTNRVLAYLAKITPQDKILDAGCGVGGGAVWIAKKIGAKVTGINISSLQLDMARQLAREQDVNNLVNFENRDYCDTKFPNNTFDVVWMNDSSCHAENKETLVREAYRILKPGGRIIVSDGFTIKRKAELPNVLRKMQDKFEDGFAIGELATTEDFKNYLRRSGFRDIRIIDKTKATFPNFLYAFIFGLPAYPLLWVLEKFKKVHPMVRKFALTAILQFIGERTKLARYLIFLASK